MTYLTSKQHRAEVRSDAVKDFKDHVIKTLVDDTMNRVHVFECRHVSGTSNLCFWVSVLPHAILVHGDIGELLIDHPSGGIGWLRGSVESMDYFLGKAYQLKETQFCPGDALALLDDEEWRDRKTREAIRAEWNPNEDEDVGRKWAETVYEILGDPEFPDCMDYDRTSLWCYEALRWFVKKLSEEEVVAA
jgi:hypothetical protein